jgi:beta-N-acetylhexosaminidase
VRIGQITLVGLEGPELTEVERELLECFRPAGVILFARNVKSAQGLRRLCDRLRQVLGRDAILGIDQEGGRVERLRQILGPLPPALAVAATGKPVLAQQLGAVCGSALKLLGLNLNLAPVVDLGLSGADNALGTRVFGQSPKLVEELARRFLKGLLSAGVEGCLKHFPGLGGARADSHHLLPVIERSSAELQDDLRPFRKLQDLGRSLMLAHAAYPALAPRQLPASRAPEIATELLRRRLGYKGCAFSDDLRMGGLGLPPAQGGIECLRAGCDALLLCGPIGEHIEDLEALQAALDCDPALRPRYVSASRRVSALRRALVRRGRSSWKAERWASCRRRARHLSAKVASLALRREGPPVRLEQTRRPALLVPGSDFTLAQRGSLLGSLKLQLTIYPLELDQREAHRIAAATTEPVLLATADADRYPGQQWLARELARRRLLAGHLQLGFPEQSTRALAPTTVFAYHTEKHFIRFSLRALLGRLPCRGIDPLAPGAIRAES